jgi:hypothetical protein
MHAPKSTHMKAIDRILRYLKGTLERDILTNKHNSNIMCDYTDSDWAGRFDQKSIIGYYIFVYENIAMEE